MIKFIESRLDNERVVDLSEIAPLIERLLRAYKKTPDLANEILPINASDTEFLEKLKLG